MEFRFSTGSADFEPEDMRRSTMPSNNDCSWLGDENYFYPEAKADLLQPPSFADSASYTSELFDLPLTQGSTLPTVFDEAPTPDAGPSRGETDSAAFKQGCDDLIEHNLDLQCFGVAPELYVNGQVERPPLLPPGNDFSTNLIPDDPSHGGCEIVPELAAATLKPRSQSMVRGRSGGLSQEAREKAADMRRFRACDRCRIRKVPCDPGRPCRPCMKDFPHHAELCERRRLLEILEHQRQKSLWLLDPNGGGWSGSNWQLYGSPVQATVAFGTIPDERSSNLELSLQLYVAGLNVYQPPRTGCGHEVSPPAATFGMVPMSTAGNWPGTSSPPQKEYHLASYGLSDRLLLWAEGQVLSESQRGISFEDAINAFIFALRDTPLNDGRATFTIPTTLVRSVCEMVSLARIWQAPVIHVHNVDLGLGFMASQPLPEAVAWELKSQAITAVTQCERTVLNALDNMLTQRIKKEKLSIWACLWQLVLIYRKLMTAYAEMCRPACEPGQAYLAETVATITQIHRLLLVKYAAYLGSSSPIYQRNGQTSTSEQLAGDTRLQRAWEDVTRRRRGFYREFSRSTTPSDRVTKILIIDAEAHVAHTRKMARRRG